MGKKALWKERVQILQPDQKDMLFPCEFAIPVNPEIVPLHRYAV